MAELLIKAVNATHSDPAKDARGCYKRGDIVDVRPDGFSWGALEILPPASGGKFVRVQITGATVAQVRNWCINNWGMDITSSETSATEVLRRRFAQVTVDSMPNNVRNQLNNSGFYSNTWANIRSFIRNKITNATASGNL